LAGVTVGTPPSKKGELVVVLDDLARGPPPLVWTMLLHCIKGKIGGSRPSGRAIACEHKTGILQSIFAGPDRSGLNRSPIQPRYYENNCRAGLSRSWARSLQAGVRRVIFSSTAAIYGDPGTNSHRRAKPAMAEETRTAGPNFSWRRLLSNPMTSPTD